MRRYSPASMVLIAGTAVIAAALTAWLIMRDGLPLHDLPAALVLWPVASVALLYPVKSARDQSSYALGNIFSFAAILMLPLSWAAVLCYVTWVPSLVQRYRASRPPRPDFWVPPLFNASQSAILSVVTGLVLTWTGANRFRGLEDVLWLGVGVILFVMGQTLFVSLMVAFYRRVPLRTVDSLHFDALVGDLYQPFLGAIWAVLWRVQPSLLVLGLVPLLLAYRTLRNIRLVRLAEIDAKTGLYNYRYFDEQLKAELPRALRLRRPLSLIFADLDYLRTINNTHGHQVGDEALVQVAGVFLTHGARMGTAARFGGEEFVILLPGVDIHEAAFMAERLRSAVAQLRIPVAGGETISVTMSFGVASCPGDGATAEALVKAADDAVYQAKAAGRNRVKLAERNRPTDGAASSVAEVAAAAAAPATETPAARPVAAASAPAPRQMAGIDPVVTGLVALVTLAGLSLTAWAVGAVPPERVWAVTVMALLAGGAQILRVDLKTREGGPRSISVAMAVTMAAAAALGSPAAVLVSLLPNTVDVITTQRRELHKIGFNFGMTALAAAAAGLPFAWFTRSGAPVLDLRALTSVALAAGLYYLVNIGLVLVMVAARDGRRPLAVWRGSMAWITPYYLIMVMTGGLIGSYATVLGWLGAGAMVVMLILIWRTVAIQTASHSAADQMAQHAQTLLEQLRRSGAAERQSSTRLAQSIIQVRDRIVGGHADQVARYAEAIALQLGLHDPETLERIRSAALLHDLGKVGIPDQLLGKPDRLTESEYETVRTHVAIGEQILREVHATADLAALVGRHTEHWDGAGDPPGLPRDELPLGARILAVADALEAMLSDKPYALGRSLEAALSELQRCAGTQFDPSVVQAVQRLAQRSPNLFVRNILAPSPAERTAPELAELVQPGRR